MLGKSRLFLVEVHRDQLEIDGRAFLQGQQQHQQGVRILAAAHADEQGVAIFDHVVVADGLANRTDELVAEFQEIAGGVRWIVLHDNVLEVERAAAIHCDDLAGDERGVLDQESHRPGDVFGLANTF